VLSGPDGVVTPQGEFYYQLTEEHAPDRTFDYNQVPTRRGDTEYARDRTGREVRLRTLQPNGQYKYSAMGKMFFRVRQVEHIVHVPVIIEGTRKNGEPYRREDYLPFDSLSVERILTSGMWTDAQRSSRVRDAVLQALSLRTLRGRPVLLEVSDETYFYDRTRPWRISTLTTTPHAGQPEVHAALNRPMGHLHSPSFVPFADQVIKEAWETRDNKLCVIRQLAAVLRESEQDLTDEFDRLLARPWQHEGLCPNDIKKFCQERQLAYYCLGTSLLDSWLPKEPKGRSVCFCTWDGHAYFYRSARVVSTWRPTTVLPGKTLQSEDVGNLPPASAWDRWDGTPRPGYFWTVCLDTARRQMLESGRNPKVTIRTLAEKSSLMYDCVKALDGSSGLCVVRELPPDNVEIAAWAARIGVEWCGERLPALTYKALLQLLKVARRTPSWAEQAEILQRQRGRCCECGEALQHVEFDHVAPLKQMQGTQPQSYRALCRKCHREVTKHEGGGRALESRFNLRAWENYVMSPRPPPLAWRPHGNPTDFKEQPDQEKYTALDVIRCRRNALFYSAHEWCIFCSLDSIIPARGKLGDFNFVTHPPRQEKERPSTAPICGPGLVPSSGMRISAAPRHHRLELHLP